MARTGLAALSVLILALAGFADLSAQVTQEPVSVSSAGHFDGKSLAAIRRFTGDGQKTLEFYGAVLGFGEVRAVGDYYEIGTSQMRFAKAPADATFTKGALTDAAGVRLWTMWFEDEAALVQRFVDHGLPPPPIRDVEGTRSVFMKDPDGEWIRLMILRGAAKEQYEHLEIGVATKDLEKSRDFYRSFLGLEELRPVLDQELGITKYMFGHGRTTIGVYSTARSKPFNRQLAGFHFLVKNVDAVRTLAQQRGFTVVPISSEQLPGPGTVGVYDPAEVMNSFSAPGR
jgi:catechol 2,3-dioxygenase-like lactoylglutathione lyase family enzyme